MSGRWQVWYINQKRGYHVLRAEHYGLMDALRHSTNLGGCDVTESGGLFSYIVDTDTGRVVCGKQSEWPPLSVKYPGRKVHMVKRNK